MLVDTGLMSKGVGAHNGLAGRDGHAGDVAQELAGVVNLPGVDAGFGLVEVPPGVEGHDDLLQAGVARPLADAVDRALHLRGAGLDAGQGVGDRHAQVIVAVDGDVGVFNAFHVFFQIGDELRHLLGRGVAHGVRHVERGGAGGHGVGVALCQKRGIGPGSVLSGELNVVAEALGIGHHGADALEDLLPGHLELILHVDIAGGQEHVDPGMLGFLHRVPGGVDVALGAAGQAGHGAVGHSGGNGLHALVVHGRGNGKSRFDDVHTQLLQLAGHFDLFRQVHAAARGLLAVSEGRVKNPNPFHAVFPPCLMPVSVLRQQKKPPSLPLKRRKLCFRGTTLIGRILPALGIGPALTGRTPPLW